MKLLYRVPEAVQALGISRSRLYELIRDGEIESVTAGRTRLIPAHALEAFARRLCDESGALNHGGGQTSAARADDAEGTLP